MSSDAKHRKVKAPAKVGAQSLTRTEGQYRTYDEGVTMNGVLYAPLHRKPSPASIIALSYFVEFLGTLFFSWAVNMARFSLTGTGEPFIGGTLLGVVSGGAYYLATGWRLNGPNQGELTHHCSWSVTIGYMLSGRVGVVTGFGYLATQTLGSLCGGGLLYLFGAGVVPTPVLANQKLTWFIEIVGPAFIVFNMLFNHMAGASLDEEDESARKGHGFAAGTRALLTAFLYQYQGYSFDHVIYFAGFIGLCNGGTCVVNVPFNNAPWFYQFVPIIGSIVAVFLYLLSLLFYSIAGVDKNSDDTRRVGKSIDRSSLSKSAMTTAKDLLDVKSQ